MTLEQFNQLKLNIKSDLERKLKLGTLPSTEYRCKIIVVPYNDLSNLRLVNHYIAKGLKPSLVYTNWDEYKGGKDPKGTIYNFKIAKPITEVTDDLVSKYMRRAITNMLIKQTGKSEWAFSLDCKVMELYKLGKIDWATVVELHKSGCSL